MASCILLHGPGARQAAYNKAIDLGHLHGEFGDTDAKRAKPKKEQRLVSLTADEAREAMSLLFDSPLYSSVGCVVIGPVDEMQAKAADVLLKGIEEFAEGVVQPILWAHDYGTVTPTIRSRSLETWVPGKDEDEDDDITAAAWECVDHSLAGDIHLIPAKVTKHCSKVREVRLMVRAVADVISTDLSDRERRALWDRVRLVAVHYNPTPTEIIAALIRGI